MIDKKKMPLTEAEMRELGTVYHKKLKSDKTNAIEKAIYAQYGFIKKIDKFRCFLCGETFIDEDSIYNHVKDIHKEIIRKNALIIKEWGG